MSSKCRMRTSESMAGFVTPSTFDGLSWCFWRRLEGSLVNKTTRRVGMDFSDKRPTNLATWHRCTISPNGAVRLWTLRCNPDCVEHLYRWQNTFTFRKSVIRNPLTSSNHGFRCRNDLDYIDVATPIQTHPRSTHSCSFKTSRVCLEADAMKRKHQ